MPYASVGSVEALNSARTFTVNSKPSKLDVEQFLADTAAALDSILRARGYTLPVATTATSALEALGYYNSIGGWAWAERSAETSPHRDAAWELWKECQQELREGNIELDLGRDTAGGGGFPRGAFASPPFFSRDMML
jgi:hypothetical protein